MRDALPGVMQVTGERSDSDGLGALTRAMRRHGVHGTLAYLNSRTRHRYTGVYIFDPPRLRNYALHDRENPGVRCMGDLDLRDTYCGIIHDRQRDLLIDNALTDARLSDHPNLTQTVAYHGFALRNSVGDCFGSLCHWDVRPRLLRVSEIPLLRAAADLIARAIGLEAFHAEAGEARFSVQSAREGSPRR